MSIGKRALIYLTRKKGRTILLIVLMFVMSCFAVLGCSLKRNADSETERLRQSLATGFILKADLSNEAYYEHRDGEGYSYKAYIGPDVTDEMIEKIMEIKGVTDYKINLADLVWVDLNLRPGAWEEAEAGADFTEAQLQLFRKQTTVWPCRTGESDTNFRTGAFTISQGRNIRENDHFKAVISEYLAEKNDLTVGDTITIETKEGIFQPSDDPFKTWGEAVELEIVGLFHPNFEQAVSEWTHENGYIDNQIYTDLDTHAVLQRNLGKETDRGRYGECTFFVEDPAQLESIMQEIRENDDIDIEGLIFKADDTAYKASVKPFRLISIFATCLLAVGIVGIGIILYLVMNLWVKRRKHEAGILLSIGISKWKIVCQMLVECLTVSAAAFILSLLLSGFMMDACAGLAEGITVPKADVQPYTVEINSSYEPVVTMTSPDEVSLEHSVSVSAVFLAAVVVCGVSCVSVLLASGRALDMEPKKLLQSM